MRYIIKNCPMYFHKNCYGHTNDCNCKDIQNCLMKQIADKLNYFWCDAVGKSFDEEETYAYISQKISDIYDLFEISEVVDEIE